MKNLRGGSLLILAIVLAASIAAGKDASAADCGSLHRLHLPHATVTLAQSVTSGSFTPPGSTMGLKNLPPFCRVALISRPSSDSLINIEVWIPLGKAWNGKYLQSGCGGYCGTLQYQYFSLANSIRRGYAGAATDDGSQVPNGASFGLAHPEKVVDFGYRALKETTDDAKAIIAALEHRSPRRSYFSGCSDGGREALMEAQRFPEDFDGIIVGAPANNWTRMFAGMVANEQALLDDPASYVPAAKLPALSRAVLAQCRAHDSGAPGDAFLSDPLSCHFDPAKIQCAAGRDANDCLTAAQVAAVRAIYSGPHDPKTGRQIVPGFVPGNEDTPSGWPVTITGASREANFSNNSAPPSLLADPTRGGVEGYYGNSFFAYFVYRDPKFDFRTFDIDAAIALADRGPGKVIDATNPDLRPFMRHGGKIIQYHGWADPILTPRNSIDYYNEVRAVMFGTPASHPRSGSVKKIQDFYRLFMMPGVGHCAGGPGPDLGGFTGPPLVDAEHDVLKALERWVEQGIAPDKIIATRYVDGDPAKGIQMQRPLCPYPEVAHYDGKGDPAKASSFSCRG